MWTRKTSRPLRRLPERARPVSRRDPQADMGPARLLVRWVWAAVLYAATALLVYMPLPPMLRPGEVALRDYVAAVDFSVEDRPATARRRQEAERITPRVFNDRPEALTALPDEVGRILERARVAEGEVRSVDERMERWLTQDEMTALAAGLRPKLIADVTVALKEFCKSAVERGVIDEKRRQKELQASRFRISVREHGGAQTEEADLFHETIEFPGKFQELLEERLKPVFESGDSASLRSALLGLVLRLAKPTLEYNEQATRKAVREATHAVQPVHSKINAGSTIVWYGDVITQQQSDEVREAYAAMLRSGGGRPGAMAASRRMAGVAVVVLLVFAGAGVFLVRPQRDLMRSNTSFAMMGVIAVSILILGRLVATLGWPPFLAPVILGALLLSLLYGPRFSMGATLAITFLMTCMLRGSLAQVVSMVAGAGAGVAHISRLRRRTQLIEAGFLAGLAQCAAVWGLGQISWVDTFPTPGRLLADSVVALVNGMTVGFVLSGALPYAERALGFVTDLSLTEWSDRNQPLLRRLALEAPGTFHHSMMVGTLAEAAAEVIGANPLLARAGGYLHDVGKLRKPEYFIENTEGRPSPHLGLSPMLSTLIITSHTKDGAGLAEQYNLPAQIRLLIEQHHGTTVVEYFYNEALREAAEPGEVNRDMFRYRGPNPSTREAGIVLLADSVESATRSLSEPTPARVESLVRDIARKRLMDRQLDEADLTFADVRKIEDSLIRSLLALFHQRIKYPEPPRLVPLRPAAESGSAKT